MHFLSLKKNGALRRLVVALAMAAAPAAFAGNVDPEGYVYLNHDDAGGTYSFAADIGHWTPSGKPSAGNKYLVQTEAPAYRILRTNENGTPFAGDSLTLDSGEIRSSGKNCCVTNLIVYRGLLGSADRAGCTFSGAYFLQRSDSTLEFRGAVNRLTTLSATVSGVAGTTLTVQNTDDLAGLVDFPFYTLKPTGSSPDYHGSWCLNSSSDASCRTALIVSTPAALGALDADPVVQCSNLGGFFGNGLTCAQSAHLIDAPQGLFLGSYTNGLALGGGVSLSGGDDLIVTNRDGATRLANVSLSGFSRLVASTEDLRFAPGYSNPGLPIVAEHDVTVDFDGTSPVSLGAVTFPGDAKIILNYTDDLSALQVETNAISKQVAVIANLTDLDLDTHVQCVGLAGATLRKAENGLLVLERAATGRPLVTLIGKTGKDVNSTFDSAGSEDYAIWSDGKAPDAANDYFVTSGNYCRGRNTATFAGHSLTLPNNGELDAQGGKTLRTDRLTLYPGSLLLTRAVGYVGTFAGAITVLWGSEGWANIANEGGGAKTIISASLTGAGDLASRGRTGNNTYDDSRVGAIVFSGDNSAFTGRFLFDKAIGMTNVFETAASVGGNPVRFTADGYALADDARVVFNQSATLASNRGIRLTDTVRRDDPTQEWHRGGILGVKSGATVTVPATVSGLGRLTKEGAGTLVLAAANTFDDGVYLKEGMLTCAHADALGTNANKVVYRSGVLRVACSGLKVGGAIPFSNPAALAKTPVRVQIAAFEGTPVSRKTDLFVLTHPNATFDETMISIDGDYADRVTFTVADRPAGQKTVVAHLRGGMAILFR